MDKGRRGERAKGEVVQFLCSFFSTFGENQLQMKLLFIQSFLEGDYQTTKVHLAVILIMWVAVGVAMTVDLFSGYRKAKQRKEARTSKGLRRTIDKAIRYYSLMIIAFLFDCIITFFSPYPIATFIFAGFIFAVELKSIWEKAKDKTKKKEMETMKEILSLIENKDNLLQYIIQSAGGKKEEQEGIENDGIEPNI
jgi:preprotein translocase subunit Sec63